MYEAQMRPKNHQISEVNFLCAEALAHKTELEHVFSRFYMLRHLMRGTLKQATDELWAEICLELEIQKKSVL